MMNEGYLNDAQNINLVLKVIKPLKNLEKIINMNRQTLKNFKLFSEHWNIQSPLSALKKKYTKNQLSPLPDSGFKKQKTTL